MALRMAAALAAALPFSSASLISAVVISLSLKTSMRQLRSVLFAIAPAAAAARPRACRRLGRLKSYRVQATCVAESERPVCAHWH